MLLARLDDGLERVGEAGVHVQAQRRAPRERPEAARGVRDVRPGELTHGPAPEPLEEPLPRAEVRALVRRAVADHHVDVTRHDGCHQPFHLASGVLVIRVGVDDDVGPELERCVQPRRERAREPEVHGEAEQIRGAGFAGDVGGAVGRAVVDDQGLDHVDAGQRARQCGQRLGEEPFLVVARDLDDQLDHA